MMATCPSHVVSSQDIRCPRECDLRGRGKPRVSEVYMSDDSTTSGIPVPHGYCRCGCGQKTEIATYSRPSRGYVKGEPLPYVRGHNGLVPARPYPAVNESGLCMCGCGRKTPVAARTNRELGHIAGKHVWYCMGHQSRKDTPKYEVDANGCWVWLWNKDRIGYGHISVDGQHHMAHRYIYEQAKGPIPDGLELDHLCCNPSCVNPDHLEPVTHWENCDRARKRAATCPDAPDWRRT
jgi:hypothetical protein